MKRNSHLKRVLEDTEYEKFRRAVAGDDTIIPTLLKIIKNIEDELSKPTGCSELSQQWAMEKAYTEGGRFYLQSIVRIFKEK